MAEESPAGAHKGDGVGEVCRDVAQVPGPGPGGTSLDGRGHPIGRGAVSSSTRRQFRCCGRFSTQAENRGEPHARCEGTPLALVCESTARSGALACSVFEAVAILFFALLRGASKVNSPHLKTTMAIANQLLTCTEALEQRSGLCRGLRGNSN